MFVCAAAGARSSEETRDCEVENVCCYHQPADPHPPLPRPLGEMFIFCYLLYLVLMELNIDCVYDGQTDIFAVICADDNLHPDFKWVSS